MGKDALRTLSMRELNRALLARQMLLERATLPTPAVLERMAGLQAQYAPSMYIGLWSRMEGLRRETLTSALERRTVVQGTLMRTTIHLVSARDYWPFAIGVRDARQRWWRRVQGRGVALDDVEAAAARVRAALEDGPVRRARIEELVGRDLATAAGLWVDLVRVPPSGTWERRRADLYAAAEDWLGPPDVTASDGVGHLVRRYLGGFGPATPAEIADWAGLPAAEVVPALGRLRLRRFRTEDGQELVDLPRAPIPDGDTPAPVRFLPTWDATLLVHARRKGILLEEHRPRIFSTKTPHSFNTFLVDGTVAGTWRHERGRIAADPFRPLARSTRAALDEEAERLAGFHS